MNASGGAALKIAIHVARARTDLTSDVQLAARAGVSYDTLMNWFAGRTTPRPAELKKVADVLDVRYGDLLDVYEGRDPRPPSIEEALSTLTDELRVLVYELRLSRVAQEEGTSQMLRALGALVPPSRAPIGTPAGTGAAARPDTRRR